MKRLKDLIKRHKSKFMALATGAIAAMSMAVAAGAEPEGTSVPTMEEVVSQAGTQLTTQFSSLVSAVVPVILSVFGVGLLLFGIMYVVRKVKSVFTKSSN